MGAEYIHYLTSPPLSYLTIRCLPSDHQEYIGTMGAEYIHYLIADPVAVPPKHDKYYTEKFLYLPHSFLANSFAYMQSNIELAPPSLELPSHDNPASNRCGLGGSLHKDTTTPRDNPSHATVTDTDADAFVYCNFNKHLKFDPTLFTSWLATLQAVPRSVLCLLENPADSIPHLTEFVRDYDPSLVDRIGYLPFHNNPFENQVNLGSQSLRLSIWLLSLRIVLTYSTHLCPLPHYFFTNNSSKTRKNKQRKRKSNENNYIRNAMHGTVMQCWIQPYTTVTPRP